ncbi:hypothetical protein AB8A24_30680, partial [Streptomyces sp. BF23-19]
VKPHGALYNRTVHDADRSGRTPGGGSDRLRGRGPAGPVRRALRGRCFPAAQPDPRKVTP